jgi:nucleotide-binding universal stress UspA family protein
MTTIVVGIDGSSASRTALSWAARRATEVGARLRIVHVVDDEWGAGQERMRASEDDLVSRAGEVSAEFPALEIDVVLASGNPSVELVRMASDAEMLVIGTHKTGFVQGRVFGSRALRLAASSDVPLAVVPAQTSGTRSGVAVGIETSAASDAAVQFGAQEARRTGDDLVLVLATGSPGPTGRSAALVDSPEMAERELEVVAHAIRVVESVSSDVGVRVRTVRRPPSQALVDIAGNVRLLVVGSSRRHQDGVAALGPVSHDVLVNIASPTVVVHPSKGRDLVPIGSERARGA